MSAFMIITLLIHDFYQQTSENRKKQEKKASYVTNVTVQLHPVIYFVK